MLTCSIDGTVLLWEPNPQKFEKSRKPIEENHSSSFKVLMIEDYSPNKEKEDSGVLRTSQNDSIRLNESEKKEIIETNSEPLIRKKTSNEPKNPSYKLISNLKMHKGKIVLDCFFDQENKTLWSCDCEGFVFVSSENGSKTLKKIEMKEPVLCMKKVENFVWFGLNKFIVVMDLINYLEMGRWRAHDGLVNQLLWVRNEVWSCSSDTTVKVWHYKTGTLLSEKKGHNGKVLSLIDAGEGQVWRYFLFLFFIFIIFYFINLFYFFYYFIFIFYLLFIIFIFF